MQEKFVLRAKTAIKRVAAISAGTMMLGASAFGMVAATDLGDYPAPFVADGQWSGLVVVGSNANAADIVGATDIVGRLTQEAVSAVSGTGITTVTGGVAGKAVFSEGIANSSIPDTVDYELEDDDIASLYDGSITFNSTSYDVRELILLNQDSPSVETSLTSTDDEYLTDAYMETNKAAMQYFYLFDKTINIAGASTTVPVKIDFLGKSLKIVSVTATGFTAYVGDEYFLNVGDSVTVNEKVITLQNVASCTTSPCNIIVDVSGTKETVSGTETVNEIEITVDETFYSDATAERSATLIVGEQASETYTNNDEYVDYCATKWATPNCKKTDPDWKWVIGGLTSNAVGDTNQSSSAPTIGIKNDYVTNDYKDNPVGVGECYDFPNDFAEICFDSYTTTEYLDLTLEWDANTDISNEHADLTDEDSISIYSTVEDTIELIAAGLGNISSNTKTDHIYIWHASTGTGEVFYEDTNNDIQSAGTFNCTDFADLNVAQITYGATKTSNVGIDMRGNCSTTSYDMFMDINDDNAAGAGIEDAADDLNISWLYSADTDFAGLGTVAGANEVKELAWGSSDISTKDEDHMTRYGIIVEDPKSSGTSDRVELQIPNDVVRANIIVKGTAATVGTTGGSVQVNSIAGVDLVKLDTEVTDKTSKPMIVVGGPCVNPLAAEALGVTFPACGASSTIPTDKALIKLVENAFGGTNVALVVAGWEAANTRDAANILKTYDQYMTELDGKMEVQVVGTSVTAVTADPVVADPVVPDPVVA